MVIYTDGSYRPKLEEISFGFIAVDDNGIIKYQYKDTWILSEKYGLYNNNEYPELKAITEAVSFAKQINQKVTICSDYGNAKSLLNVTSNFKKKNAHKFKKYFLHFMEDNKEFYELNFIKGHSNNKYHNYIDRLCRTRKKDTNKKIKEVHLDITDAISL